MTEGITCGHPSGCDLQATVNTASGPRCEFHAGWEAAKAYASLDYDALVAALKAVEWVTDHELPKSIPWCPCCHNSDYRGHAPDCQLAAAIKEADE
jgi:hypothetical protein